MGYRGNQKKEREREREEKRIDGGSVVLHRRTWRNRALRGNEKGVMKTGTTSWERGPVTHLTPLPRRVGPRRPPPPELPRRRPGAIPELPSPYQ
ncbi:hypothetical protein FH972_005462 [Carpinus fangiana]|uniref:Uncharacterized protein n=1 Tax=Carpinus fangiana TaxID=176857 RepID=A0A5N6QPP9_9ROSI|nr:hypothetical protein FH972_005462 [Carpinus fangiana]